MKTVLGILTLTAMMFTLNTVAVAADLKTPLFFNNGFSCLAYNMGKKKIEIEVTQCLDLNDGNMECSTDPPITIEPGEWARNILSRGSCLPSGCISICSFSFKGSPDNISAGGFYQTWTGETVIIPAE